MQNGKELARTWAWTTWFLKLLENCREERGIIDKGNDSQNDGVNDNSLIRIIAILMEFILSIARKDDFDSKM